MTNKDTNISNISAQTRLTSIDVFRALTILILVFFTLLNERSFKVTNIPTWMWHAEPPNGMTIVDLISPFFVFIVGMCIPIAITGRLKQKKSYLHVWTHILIRTVSLMIMGIIMANMWQTRSYAHPIGMSINLWSVLVFVSFFLIWNQYPKSHGFKLAVFIALRTGGFVLLIYLAAIFRIERPDLSEFLAVLGEKESSWFKFGEWGFWSWWVLGVIGWCYLVSCAVYTVFRKQIAGVIGCLGLLILMYVGDNTGVFDRFHFLDGVRHYVPFGTLLGTWPFMSTAGVLVGILHTDSSPSHTPLKRIMWILIFAAGLFIAGFLICPFYGISSGMDRATPTWALYSCSISCVVYAFFYWLLDMRGIKKWANFILPTARNPLAIYLLSRMIYPLFGLLHIDFINNYFNSGIAGISRTILYTALLVLFSRWLTTRCHIILRL